jgi:hypothetical protein
VEYSKTPCSEFPNDNPDLHDGPSWYAADEDDSYVDSIEVLDELVFDTAPEDEPAAPEAEPASHAPADPFYTLVAAMESSAMALGATPNSIALLRAMLGATRMDTIEPTAALDDLVSAGLVSQSTMGFVRSERLTREVVAWQDILREKSDDFAACGSAALDEWASNLVTRVLGGALRPDAVRRDLRKRGVAAFGLLAAA